MQRMKKRGFRKWCSGELSKPLQDELNDLILYAQRRDPSIRTENDLLQFLLLNPQLVRLLTSFREFTSRVDTYLLWKWTIFTHLLAENTDRQLLNEVKTKEIEIPVQELWTLAYHHENIYGAKRQLNIDEKNQDFYLKKLEQTITNAIDSEEAALSVKQIGRILSLCQKQRISNRITEAVLNDRLPGSDVKALTKNYISHEIVNSFAEQIKFVENRLLMIINIFETDQDKKEDLKKLIKSKDLFSCGGLLSILQALERKLNNSIYMNSLIEKKMADTDSSLSEKERWLQAREYAYKVVRNKAMVHANKSFNQQQKFEADYPQAYQRAKDHNFVHDQMLLDVFKKAADQLVSLDAILAHREMGSRDEAANDNMELVDLVYSAEGDVLHATKIQHAALRFQAERAEASSELEKSTSVLRKLKYVTGGAFIGGASAAAIFFGLWVYLQLALWALAIGGGLAGISCCVGGALGHIASRTAKADEFFDEESGRRPLIVGRSTHYNIRAGLPQVEGREKEEELDEREEELADIEGGTPMERIFPRENQLTWSWTPKPSAEKVEEFKKIVADQQNYIQRKAHGK